MSHAADLDRSFVWHPFTQMRDWIAEDPLVIERGDGNYLFDENGRRYFDGTSSLWVNVHGHRRKEIDDAIRHQLGKVGHSTLLGLSSGPAAHLAKALVQIAPPGLRKVFYSDNGSTAVEIALKMAYQYWYHRGRPEKRRFLALEEAYHGDTLGAVSIGGIELFHQLFAPLLVPCHRIPPDPLALERLLEERAHEIAALVVEPSVQAAAGIRLVPKGFLRAARELCERHEILLIVDEVATGFGRTGRMFACEHEDVTPDLMAVAKGLTGGYLPLAATLATDAIFEAFLGASVEQKTFFHGHTYTGNALACAAALASLEIFRSDRVLERMEAKIAIFRRELESLQGTLAVRDVRQQGFMVGVELAAPAGVGGTGARVCAAARDEGLLIRPIGDVIILMPPLSTSQEELVELVRATRTSIHHVCA